MRDKTHTDHVENWARHVKETPRSEWIKEIKPLVDSQVIMANRFYARLAKEKGGAEKIMKIRGISPEVRPEGIIKEKTIRTGKVSEMRKRYGK